MFDFLTPTFVLWIITYGIYKLIELFVCKKERVMLIERLSEKNLRFPENNLPDVSAMFHKNISFNALKAGCLLAGLGLGLLIGYILNIANYAMLADNYELRSIVYAAPLLLCGGAGLLIAFVIETKMDNKKE